MECWQEKERYEALCEELKTEKESEIEELQSNLRRLQSVSSSYLLWGHQAIPQSVCLSQP